MEQQDLLFRQVHPTFIQAGVISSQAFRPTAKDEGLLSAYHGGLISAENSWRHYTGVQKLKSAGSWAISVAECAEVDLEAREDPLENFPEHAVIDFNGLSTSAIKMKAEVLKANAITRGCQFAP